MSSLSLARRKVIRINELDLQDGTVFYKQVSMTVGQEITVAGNQYNDRTLKAQKLLNGERTLRATPANGLPPHYSFEVKSSLDIILYYFYMRHTTPQRLYDLVYQAVGFVVVGIHQVSNA